MDIALLIVTLVIAGLLPLCSIYFVVYFQHEEDKLTAWAPKIITVLGLTLAGYNLFLLPLDIANRQYGKLPIKGIAITLFSLDILFSALIIPFMILYYEGIPTQKTNKSIAFHQTIYACKWIIPVIVVLTALTIPLYIFFGHTKISQVVLNSKFVQGNASLFSNFCDATSVNSVQCSRTTTFTTMRTNPMIFVLALVDLMGWVLLSVLGSVGAISMFWDSLREFQIRNSLLTMREFESEKGRISKHAERLLTEHGKISQLGEGDGLAQREAKARKRHFIKQVIQLENEYETLQYRNKERQQYLWANASKYALFAGGVLSFLVYLLWAVQVIVYALPKSFFLKPPLTFLNVVLMGLRRVPLFSTIIYLTFSSFLILFVVKGLVKLSSVFSWLAVYPIRMGETTMNSILFNTEVILFCSISASHLAILSFFEYAANTYAAMVFVNQIQGIVLFKYVYIVFLFTFLALAPVTLLAYTISSCVRSRRRRRKRNMQNQSKAQTTSKGTKNSTETEGSRISAENEAYSSLAMQSQIKAVQNNSSSNAHRSPFFLK